MFEDLLRVLFYGVHSSRVLYTTTSRVAIDKHIPLRRSSRDSTTRQIVERGLYYHNAHSVWLSTTQISEKRIEHTYDFMAHNEANLTIYRYLKLLRRSFNRGALF